MLELNESFIAIDLVADSDKEVIENLAARLYAAGCVSKEYGYLTWKREQLHPTGLPTKPFCIAFPHADAEGVHNSSLAVAKLLRPVLFKNMADPDEELEVHLVLMLANKNPEEQIETLRNLALLFGESDKLVALLSLSTPQATSLWLRRELHLD